MPSTRAAHIAAELLQVSETIVACTRCPRLREYCTALGETKRRAYLDWDYWTLPVPGFGDPNARVLIVGLAPGAHGANRTGRPFTGDGAGNFMYPVLYDTGFASQPTATSRTDGLKLRYARIASICRCAPPRGQTHAAGDSELLLASFGGNPRAQAAARRGGAGPHCV